MRKKKFAQTIAKKFPYVRVGFWMIFFPLFKNSTDEYKSFFMK